ncbi:MAG: FHA domain-containing protein [Clostridia bacterium]|nr:FHA domain-containing protein [Clostridia bacterium]
MDFIVDAGRWLLPVLAAVIVVFCVPSLLKGNAKIGVTGYLVNEANGDRIPLSGYEVSVGRSKVCDIILGYNTVSRFHAVLSKHKSGWRVTDTGSKTGTYINSEKIDKPRALENGDTLVFGNAVFVFVENTPIEPQQTVEQYEQGTEEYVPDGPVTYIIDESTGDAYRIDGLLTCMIGRGDDVQIQLNRPNVSRRHAMLVFDEGQWSVTDMDSQFGTMLNGKPVRRMTKIKDGDTIDICGTTYVFRTSGEVSA